MENKIKISMKGNYINVKDALTALEVVRDLEAGKPYEERSGKSKIFNRFSGEYFSPTFISGFDECPARCFMSSFIPRTSSPVANLGSCTHKVFEKFVKEKVTTCKDEIEIAKSKQGVEQLNEIRAKRREIISECVKEFDIQPEQQATLERKYIPNFMMTRDYLDPSKMMSWWNIRMETEFFLKTENLKVFDIDLGPCYTLMDRVDFRPEGIFVIDYKTGAAPYNQLKEEEFKMNYINQMICYSWIIEDNFGMKPQVFAYLPDNNSYIKFPVESLELQSKFVEKILRHKESIKEQRAKMLFEQRTNIHCKYCHFSQVCNAYNKTNISADFEFDLNNLK